MAAALGSIPIYGNELKIKAVLSSSTQHSLKSKVKCLDTLLSCFVLAFS